MAKTTVKNSKPLWAGRLSHTPESDAFNFQASISIDKRLVFDDIQASRAHVSMLGKQGIIPKSAASQISKELETISSEIKTGKLKVTEDCEDIHSFLETALTQRLGDIGKMVHAGRSRNDQVAAAFRLHLKRVLPELQGELAALINTLLDIAQLHVNSLMPGYTHLQRAQCVTLGHHLAAWCCALERDYSRFTDAINRLDECPLGSGALASSSLPLDRKSVSLALGFDRLSVNSMDAVSDRDFALEITSVTAITMVHLSRFCEDVVLWASEEFKYVELSDMWSTGSSIMPQKKNPDYAELIRGKTGRAAGNLVTLFTLLKGLPYAYNKDLQEDKEALFDSIDTLSSCLRMFEGMIKSAAFNLKRMKAHCIGGFLEATDAAEYLVRKGMPFREAHEIAGKIVRNCIESGLKQISALEIAELKKHSKLFEEDIYKAITPNASVRARSLPGGPAPKEVKRQIKIIRKRIK